MRMRGQVFAQPAHQDLAQHDDDRRIQAPGGQPALPDQHHQRRADQQLVGDRIEHAAEIGLLVPGAGDPAVEIVGDGGAAEQHTGGKVGRRLTQRYQHHQQRDGHDARQRQQVRQVGQHRAHPSGLDGTAGGGMDTTVTELR